jgi:anaerobic ribonucleoside-triphosphate reductase
MISAFFFCLIHKTFVRTFATFNFLTGGISSENRNESTRADFRAFDIENRIYDMELERDFNQRKIILDKDIGKKILPKDIVDAHNKGLIHFHDLDYSPVQKMSNCCLVNLKDMLENGFALNSTPIHKTTQGFKTDCTLASQIAPQVAGQQYGGQTMSWAHIARSIQTSRHSIVNDLIEEDLF